MFVPTAPSHAALPPKGSREARGDSGTIGRDSSKVRRGFRPDVEGLRAVAILLVVLYHCQAGVSGGYIGVDVFFVISGFLITSQLVRELRTTGRLSFRGFYARRIRRILPAATLTTVVTVLVSGLVLSPLAARREFGDARAAAVFVANIHFAARDADYFNATLPPSPMQHYWSLSVEEQFYFVWPLLLVLSSLVWLRVRRRSANRSGPREAPPASLSPARRPRLRAVVAVLGAVALFSFADSVIQTPQSPAWAYYSITTRAWELAAGALVALSLPLVERLDGRLAAALTWLGAACIGIAAFALNDSTPYPGVAALLPVAGAVAIIAAGSAAIDHRGAETLLGTPPFQRVGGWSYSWYLWHWPVLILGAALLGHSLSEPEALAMASLSLVLAVISFVLVEQPIRHMQVVVRHPSVGLAGGATLVAASLSVVALSGPMFVTLSTGNAVAAPTAPTANTGTTTPADRLAADLREGMATRKVPRNLDPPLSTAAQDKPLIAKDGCLLNDAGAKTRGCVFGDTKSHTSVVLFGDSHAASWFPAMDVVSAQQHWRLVVLTKSGCPAEEVNVIRHSRVYTNCVTWRRDAMRQIATLHPALVVVASSQYNHGARPLAGVPTGYGSTWQNGVAAIFSFLHRSASRVVFISDVPRLRELAPDCLAAHMSDVPACTIGRAAAVYDPPWKAQELRLAHRTQIDAIDPFSWFCTPTGCPVIVGNILLYQDDQHVTPQWSRFLAPVLTDALIPILQTQK
jgi:peptidoglycan/LPS O-acetylase OafA/YrhL